MNTGNDEMSNRELLEGFLRDRTVQVAPGPLLYESPAPLGVDFDFSKVEGMLLGVAFGDSLGRQSEGKNPDEKFSKFGEIRDYPPNREGKRIAGPSDDTQLTFWTLEQLLTDGRLIPANVSDRFMRDRIKGIGRTVLQFIENKKSGLPWYKCGHQSAGNGALMRISPILIPYLKNPSSDLWVDAILCSMITHNDSASISSCVAFVKMLWDLLSMKEPPESFWWLNTFVEVCSKFENETLYSPGDIGIRFEGRLSQYVQEYVPRAYRKNLSTKDACNSWHSGAYLLATVPCMLYILMKHAHDPEEAIVRAINDTRDNDTIASIVGAAVGALHGKAALPDRWIKNLSGRTTENDPGKVFELIEQTRTRW